ncbi:MAG TPA: aldolase/citrate lyase family protein [Dehalococcoidia bacterium]|nr:aldolase/citrate lyase family protein [Dehalococcoidia bacterium]MDP6273855.1 aldolase/citrate lyase family protein [Dehalococcoidia bacterium]MDP7160021.1 aldolase/citrate lyase family protein [Dehalococcoidia bacterium]MDP7212362.1 aldolase/citrate lyase family protein [Dehalococcoidia bacterium]MDP7513842.1 aldolase/citrate lyase family protein [Dehalococcoidia bacterium]
MNAVKDLLKSGKTIIGTAGSPHPEVTAVLADAGYDFLLFDTQHSPHYMKDLAPGIQATNGKKAAPFARVDSISSEQILFALDAGARGIIVPMVNTRAEAEYIVESCRYYPAGKRSNGGVRGEWGQGDDYQEYMDTVNRDLVIIPMIETNEAIGNIDDILSVDGIDVALIGPSDYSIELGVTLDYTSAEYEAGLDRLAEAAKRNNVVPGMYFIPPGMDPNWFVAKGFKMFTIPWATAATEGIQNTLNGINRD